MDSSQNCIALIKGSEGKHEKLPDGRYRAYLDTLAKPAIPTIYCGLTKGVKMGMIITEDQGEKMFSREMNVYEDAVEQLVTVPINQNMFDALVSLTYNIGPGKPGGKGGLANSTLLKLLNQGKYEQAAAQFHRYHYAGGVSYNGLVKRRAAEAALFMTPMSEDVQNEADEAPPLPQGVEAAPVVPMTEAIRKSGSVKLAAAAIPGAAITWWDSLYNWTFGIASQAGTDIVETQKILTPFSAILKLTPTLLITITLGCLVAVAIRQIIKRRNGTAT